MIIILTASAPHVSSNTFGQINGPTGVTEFGCSFNNKQSSSIINTEKQK